MKREEAISLLEELIRCVENGWYEVTIDEMDMEAFKMAIEALSKTNDK